MEVVSLVKNIQEILFLRVMVFVGGEILVLIQFGDATRENVDIMYYAFFFHRSVKKSSAGPSVFNVLFSVVSPILVCLKLVAGWLSNSALDVLVVE